jgi:hypothetical protein
MRQLNRERLSWMAVLLVSMAGCRQADPLPDVTEDARIARAFDKMRVEQARTDCEIKARDREVRSTKVSPADTVKGCGS